MRFAAAALALVPAVLAAPTTLHKHHARQSCSNPSSNASCMDLVTSCVNSGVNWSNPWNSRICTVAATCAGVGNLLAFARCRGSTVQAPNTLPNLDYNVYASVVGNCAWAPGGCPITPQNYIDFVYSQIVSAWPPSGAWVVSNWWNPIASWAAFPDGRIPYTNFNDWLHWSSTLPPPGNGGGGNPGTGPLQGVQTTCHHDVSLSFDDGPYTWNDDLRNLFNNNNAKTTFFVNGNNYGCIYSEENVANLRAAYEAGHTIASHTWSHANMAGLNNAQLATEIDLLETALWKILGIKPALIRPPYGSYNQGNIDYLNSRGYTVVTWDLDTGDSLGASVGDSMNTVRSQATGHSMILMHETLSSTVFDLAPQVIGHVRNSLGAGLVTVDQCLDISPYQAVDSYGTRDSTWVC